MGSFLVLHRWHLEFTNLLLSKWVSNAGYDRACDVGYF